MISSSPPPIKPLNGTTEEITTQTETPIYMDKYSLEYFPSIVFGILIKYSNMCKLIEFPLGIICARTQ